jgi:methylenetetrahydrofolate reductase (NADPH)
MRNTFEAALLAGEFVVSVEMVPGRGAGREPHQLRALEDGLAIWRSGRVHALSVTDSPSGSPAILADDFAQAYNEQGVCTMVHMSCKDRNRNQLLAQLYALERHGLQNVLCMTGDWPVAGFHGRPMPVFDLDSIQLLQLAAGMNDGLTIPTPRGERHEQPAHFFTGCCVSPYKYTASETLGQYQKLEKKIAAGAKYVITQLGYDMRKARELLLYLRERDLHTPVLGFVYLLGTGAGRFIHGGGVPGGVVSDALLATLETEEQTADKGVAARRERAAQMIAAYRGLGFAGVHIGGPGLDAELVTGILDRADELAVDWRRCVSAIDYGQPGGFYLYEGEGDEAGAQRSYRQEVDAYETGGLSPLGRCPKGQRNGPCGGTSDGWCEVYPGKTKCVWVNG